MPQRVVRAVQDVLAGRRPVRRPRPLDTAARLLPMFRLEWEADRVALADVRLLTDEQRALVKPILRTFNVLYVATGRSRIYLVWRLTALVLLQALCLFGPPLVLVALVRPLRLAPLGLSVACLVYVALFGALVSCYFGWFVANVWWLVAVCATVFTAGVLGLANLVLPAAARKELFGGARLALVAAAIALVLIVLSHKLLWMHRYFVVLQTARRNIPPMPPSQVTAAHLFYLLVAFHDRWHSWRLPKVRAALLRELRNTGWSVERDVPRAARPLRLDRAAMAETVRRCRHAGAVLRVYELRLLGLANQESYAALCEDLAAAVTAVARGDWSLLTADGEPVYAPTLGSVTRRIAPAVLLIGAALTLGWLPSVDAGGTAITGIQVGLAVAGVVSLLPVDAWHRDTLLSAIRDVAKPGP